MKAMKVIRAGILMLGMAALLAPGARAQTAPAATTAATTATATASNAAATSGTQLVVAAPTPTPVPTPAVDDLDTTIPLQLKNANMEAIVKFLSETIGKPIIFNQNEVGSAQITVVSPKPLTKRRALELIYDALLMQGVYVVPMGDQIRIIKADALKNMQFETVGQDVDVQSLPDSDKMVQKVYKLHNVSPDTVREQLGKMIPESSMTFDAASGTLILVDQLERIKRFDRIIQALDRPDEGDQTVEFFPLANTEAPELAELLSQVLMPSEGDPNSRTSRRGSSSGAASFQVGAITIVPDSRTNTLIVACPRAKLAQIRELVHQLDQSKPEDVQLRMVAIKFVNPRELASSLSQLFSRSSRLSEKEQVQIVPYEDGSRLIVRSSKENFDKIQRLIEQIDTPEAEQRETRTYEIEHLQAADLADQLNTLFKQSSTTAYTQSDYSYSYTTSRQEPGQPVFVPISRNNSLVVMAKAKDFKFIEQMIGELDKAVDLGTFEPHIYQVRNTDANELVKILESLFTGQSSSTANLYNWRPQTSGKDSIKDLFGDIRFVVDTVTNRVVVLTSHPENYPIVGKMIEQIDHFDPDASSVLTYELKYADAIDVADHLNNLFSEGAVQRPNQQPNGPQNNNRNNNNNNNSNDGSSGFDVEASLGTNDTRTIIYPWQSGGRERNANEPERPINTMIGNVRVVPDERSSKLIIAAPAIYFEALRHLIEQLDQPEPQVNIHTRVLEITRGNERRIGVRWTPDPSTIQPAELDNAIMGLGQLGFLDTAGNPGVAGGAATRQTNYGGVTRSLSQVTGAGSTVLGADVNLTLLMQLLLKNSNSQILSDPSITVNNNQKGVVFVGNQYPFRRGSTDFNTGTSSNQIDYRKIGVTLGLKPQINADGKIVMTIGLENSSIADERISGDLVTNLTTLNTQVAVDTSETLVIGGILIDSQSEINRQTPFLGRIPLIGWLFKKKDGMKTTRELMVFLTPEVLRTRDQDQVLLDRTMRRVDQIDPEGTIRDLIGEPRPEQPDPRRRRPVRID